jgi:hypothetical protein
MGRCRAIAANEVGQARLHAVEDADQPVPHPVALSQVASELLLAERRRVQVAHRPTLARGERVRRATDAIAQPRRVGAEVLEQHPRLAQVPLHETGLIQPAQARSQPQPIDTPVTSLRCSRKNSSTPGP